MEHWEIYSITALGALAIVVYLYLLLIKKSEFVKKPSKVVVIGLFFTALIGWLIRYSQIFDQELTYVHYLDMSFHALMLPSVAVGIGLIKALVSYIGGIVGANIN
ncbi:hypothetical protein [Paraglaciecola arctica]|uniref:hypothetical protein n=1 Tax=Paraglaciecola arctica TaxID=1128911 RepID=UPI001C06A531|nr:hypothetical protein [Paraglaciecola arctica]MBU3006081.1 hypothetical protein [Paraglaciecola arctica]